MKNAKTIIAYLLVAVFLLGSIAASAQTKTNKPMTQTISKLSDVKLSDQGVIVAIFANE